MWKKSFIIIIILHKNETLGIHYQWIRTRISSGGNHPVTIYLLIIIIISLL